jgi:hypothetical protein
MTALEAPVRIAEPRERLDLGRVVGRTFGAIGGNFITFFLLAILFAAVPSVLMGFALGYFAPILLAQVGYADYGTVNSLIGVVILLLTTIPTYILIGALTQGSIVHYNGYRARFAECLGTGFRFFLPLIGLAIVSILGLILWMLPALLGGVILAGFAGMIFAQMGNYFAGSISGIIAGIATFIPAVMAVVRWSAAAPALVAERTGVMAAFARSGTLTRNNRWAIFLLALVWTVISVGIQWAITFVGTSTLMGLGGSFALGGLLLSGFTILYSALNTMILATGQAALYYELRVLKEGATSEELAKVFE